MPIVTARSEGEALPSGQLIKAIYDYTADVLESKVLSFSSGDHFVVIKSTKPEEWLYVVSAAGRLGYIPANFITIDILPDKSFLSLLDTILATLTANSTCAANPPNGESADILTVRQINHAKVKLSQVRSEIVNRITSNNGKSQIHKQSSGSLEKRASLNTLDDVESTRSEELEGSEKDKNVQSIDGEVDEEAGKSKGDAVKSFTSTVQRQEEIDCISNHDKCLSNEVVSHCPQQIDPAKEDTNIEEKEKVKEGGAVKRQIESDESVKGGSNGTGSKSEGHEESVKGSSKECMIEKDERHHRQESREGHGEDECRVEHPQLYSESCEVERSSEEKKKNEMASVAPGSPKSQDGDDDDRAEASLQTLEQKVENKDTAEYSSTGKVEQADHSDASDKLNINCKQNTLLMQDDKKNTPGETDDPAQVQVNSTCNATSTDDSIKTSTNGQVRHTRSLHEEDEPSPPTAAATVTATNHRLDLPLDKKCSGGSSLDTTNKSPNMQDDAIESTNLTQMDDKKLYSESLIHQLIESVRVSSDLNHNKCKKTIDVILSTLIDAYPQWSDELHQLLCALHESSAVTPATNHHWLNSSDMSKLQKIFATLLSVSSNEQQRSWPIHQDEEIIHGLLVDLHKLLIDANPLMTRELIASNDFDHVTMLTTYFQMETRRSIRLQLMRVMIQMIKLENRCISEVFLSHSGVPASLADELKCHLYDDERWSLAAKLLTLVFATGHKPPITIYEHINEKFATFLMAVVECDFEQLLLMGPPAQANASTLSNARPSSSAGRATPLGPPCELPSTELSIPLVLALNLHLQSSFDHNFILTVLAKKQTCSQLTENLVSSLNWEEDPTFDSTILSSASFAEDRKNAVHKLLIEILTYKQTASLFYLNDTRVLMDIIISHLNNLEPQVAKERIACLEIAQQVLKNTSYLEDPPNKMADLLACLNGIIAEESLCQQEKTLAINVQQLIQTASK